jgi:hypothetical protein
MTEYKPEDYIKYRIERARETIVEVQAFFDYDEETVLRLYPLSKVNQSDGRTPDRITTVGNRVEGPPFYCLLKLEIK